MALNLSEQRLAAFDRALQSLDERRAHHLISARDYVFKRDYVVGFIINEAQFQNAILTKDPPAAALISFPTRQWKA